MHIIVALINIVGEQHVTISTINATKLSQPYKYILLVIHALG